MEPLLLICIIGAIALLLFAIEALITPGFGVAGIGATTCVALTRLALIGNADIEGQTVEVKSAGQFIEEGTPIVVVSVNDALILVKPKA